MTVKFSKNLVIWEGVTIANAYLYSESFHHHISYHRQMVAYIPVKEQFFTKYTIISWKLFSLLLSVYPFSRAFLTVI